VRQALGPLALVQLVQRRGRRASASAWVQQDPEPQELLEPARPVRALEQQGRVLERLDQEQVQVPREQLAPAPPERPALVLPEHQVGSAGSGLE
jgi:hypothetical protein